MRALFSHYLRPSPCRCRRTASHHINLHATLVDSHECITAEALAQRDDSYDLVLASEVIEHVRHPDQFIKTLSLLLQRPGAGSGAGSGGGGDRDGRGGTLIVSTMNRTAESLAVAIVGAEYLMRIVPRGTHEWHRFITPQELTLMAEQVGIGMRICMSSHISEIILKMGNLPNVTLLACYFYTWQPLIRENPASTLLPLIALVITAPYQAQQQLEPQMMAGIGLTSGGLMQLTDHLGVNYIASFGFKPSA